MKRQKGAFYRTPPQHCTKYQIPVTLHPKRTKNGSRANREASTIHTMTTTSAITQAAAAGAVVMVALPQTVWEETQAAIHEMKQTISAMAEGMNQQDQKEWLGREETMQLLQISPATLQRYRDRHVIEFSQWGRKILYSRKSIEKLMQDHFIAKGGNA